MYAKDFDVFGYAREVPPSPPLAQISRPPTRRSFWDYRPQPRHAASSASVTPACSSHSMAGACGADGLGGGGGASTGDPSGFLGGESDSPHPTGRMSPGPPLPRLPSAEGRMAFASEGGGSCAAPPSERTALVGDSEKPAASGLKKLLGGS